MANYGNISGTMKKAFKVGPHGVVLTSKAIFGGGTTINRLITDQMISGSDSYYQVAYEDPNDPLYAKFDGFISSENISSLQYLNGNLRVNLKNNTYVDIATAVNTVTGPQSSTDNDIVLFDGTSGSSLKDSSYKISSVNNLGDYVTYDSTRQIIIDQAANNSVPTTTSILNYIGTLDKALSDRIDGKL